jgi:hypothetical protein
MHISAAGTIDDLVHGKGLALHLSGGSDALSSLLKLIKIDAPPLGDFRFQAEVVGDAGAPFISDLSLTFSGNPQLDASVTGKVDNAFSGSGMNVQFYGSCSNHAIFRWLLPNTWPRLEVVQMKGALRESSGMLNLEDLELETSAEQMSLKIGGRIPLSEGWASEGVQLETSVTIKNTESLKELIGKPIPSFGPVFSHGHLVTNKQTVAYTGEIRVGDTVLESSVSGVLSGTRPRFEATIHAAKIKLEDFGFKPSPPADQSGDIAEMPSPPIRVLFSDRIMPFDALKAVDINLAMDIGVLTFKDSTTGEVSINANLEGGRLHIYPASIVYADGITEFDVVIDASTSPPAFIMKMTAEDVDIGDMLAIAQQPMVLSGDLNLAVDMQSTGHSTHDIASALDGKLSFAMENGEIRRIVNYLSADALNLLLNTADQRQFTTLNCLVGGIQFANGIGEIDWFAMDTSRIRATAAGSVNLVTATIDVGINPIEKQRLFLREGSAVQIYGPMNMPTIRVLPISEATRLYGTLLMPHVFLSNCALGSLWYLVSRDGDTSPCLQAAADP